MWLTAEMKREETAATAAPTGLKVAVCSTVLVPGSTSRQWAARKLTPRMGLDTAARRKVHINDCAPKQRFLVTFHHEEIDLLSAPANGGPVGTDPDL